MGYRIVTNGTFQHHGILGQKWGVITKNVGVNYIPIGDRRSSAKETAGRVLKGAASGAKAVGQAVTGAGKAIARGAKAVKADHDARVAKKQASAYRSDNRLTKKQISRMTDAEVQAAINRRQNEKKLYDLEHPQIKAGKEFLDKYVKDYVLAIGGDYTKKFIDSKVSEGLGKFIRENKRYSPEDKAKLLDTLGLLNSDEKLNKAISDNDKIAKLIDSKGLDPLRAYTLKKQYNVNTPKDDLEYEIMKNVTSAKNVDNIYSALRKELGSDTADRIMKTAKYSAIVKNNNGKNNSNPYDFTEEELEKLRNIIHDYI